MITLSSTAGAVSSNKLGKVWLYDADAQIIYTVTCHMSNEQLIN